MSSAEAPRQSRLSNLQARVLTAVVGIPILIAMSWVGGWPFALMVGAAAALAAAEFIHGWLFPSLPITQLVRQPGFVLPAAFAAAGAHASLSFPLLGIAAAALMAAVGYSNTNAFGPRRPYRVQAGALIYAGVLLSAAVLVRDADDGRTWLLIGVAGTFAVDTGAYATGKAIGRHKLAPHISPGKTWEGAVGGYVAGAGAVFALNELLDTGVPASTLVHFAVAMPVVAQAGDLFESWLKRRMGVKDASSLLPGHGGFLDRLDSLMPVLALLYLFLRYRVQ